MGSPRFTQESSNYYVWVLTTAGRVYKIQDTGSALTTVGGYPFRDGASATGTSPLATDNTNIYWAGNNGSGARKLFSLPLTSTTLNGTGSLAADMTALPAVLTSGGTSTLYSASTARSTSSRPTGLHPRPLRSPTASSQDGSRSFPTSSTSSKTTARCGRSTPRT